MLSFLRRRLSELVLENRRGKRGSQAGRRARLDLERLEERTVPSTVDLTITKTDGSATEVPGTSVTYTIVASNNGPLAAAGVTVDDTFALSLSGVTFTSVAAGGATGNTLAGTGDINDTVSMPVGSSITYTATATISPRAIGSLSNTARIAPAAGDTDSNPTDNTATDTDTLTPEADLQLTKTDAPDPVVAGTDLTYTITVTNAGPSDAQSVSLSDPIPANTTFVSAMQTTGPAFTLNTPSIGGTGTFTATAATFAAGASATFTLTVKVNASTLQGATISNTATVNSTTTDTNPANNSDTETTAVNAEADVQVTKADSPDPVTAGSNLTYTITVANTGPSDAQAVSLSDLIPANTTFVSATQPSGQGFTLTTPPVGGTGTFTATRATFAAGANATFTLVVKVNANTPQGATISNTATVTSTTTDPTAGNNSATQTTSVNVQADLQVTKADAPDPVFSGTNLTYTITLTNAGPSDAQAVSLSDAIPANTTFVSATQTSGPAFTLTTPPAGGTGTFTATRATLAAAASATFRLVVKVNFGISGGTLLSNTATVSSTTTDPTAANNSATQTTTVNVRPIISFAISATTQQVQRQRLDLPSKTPGAWVATAPGAFLDIAVTEYSSSRTPVVFALGVDHRIYEATFNAQGDLAAGWFLVAPGFFDSLDAGLHGDDSPFVVGIATSAGNHQAFFARFGSDGRLVEGWRLIAPGSFTSAVVGKVGSGNPIVFGLATAAGGNQAYAARFNTAGQFISGWGPVAPGAFSLLETGNRNDGTLELFGLGVDHHPYGANFNNFGAMSNGWFPITSLNATAPTEFATLSATAAAANRLIAFALPFAASDQRIERGDFNSAGTLTSGWNPVSIAAFRALDAGTQTGFIKLYAISAVDNQAYLQLFDETGAVTDPFFLTSPGTFTKVKAAP